MRAIGIINSETKFEPADFDNDRLKCIGMLKTPKNKTAAVMKSRFDIPEHWYVIYGTSRLCFTDFDEAVDYCLSRGFKLVANSFKGGL